MSTDLVLLAVLMFAVTYPTRAVGILTPGLGQRFFTEHGFDRAVNAVVTRDAIEMPLHDLRDGVFLLGVKTMQVGHRDVEQILIDRVGGRLRGRWRAAGGHGNQGAKCN